MQRCRVVHSLIWLICEEEYNILHHNNEAIRCGKIGQSLSCVPLLKLSGIKAQTE